MSKWYGNGMTNLGGKQLRRYWGSLREDDHAWTHCEGAPFCEDTGNKVLSPLARLSFTPIANTMDRGYIAMAFLWIARSSRIQHALLSSCGGGTQSRRQRSDCYTRSSGVHCPGGVRVRGGIRLRAHMDSVAYASRACIGRHEGGSRRID